jgi:hypothetical protein
MFGGQVQAQRFHSLPLVQQCTRCWALGHMVQRCPRPKAVVVCSICGGAHPAKEHQFKCPRAMSHSTLKCDCPRKCLNCTREKLPAQGHLSTDLSCPLRKKFRSPSRRTGVTTDEEGPMLHLMSTGGNPSDPLDLTDV